MFSYFADPFTKIITQGLRLLQLYDLIKITYKTVECSKKVNISINTVVLEHDRDMENVKYLCTKL